MSYRDPYLFIEKFFIQVSGLLANHKVSIEKGQTDHVCWRVATKEEYDHYLSFWKSRGTLLKINEIGGRPIATFKLNTPLIGSGFDVDIVELPAPKKSSSYPTGWEHVEIVIEKSFQEFIDNHEHLSFDISAMTKERNPEIKLQLNDNYAAKFHHQSLESLLLEQIEEEKK